MKRVRLDHNAGSTLRPAARERLIELAAQELGNPSSAHADGRRARDVLEEAREELAALVGCERDELVFTSGGTESNALALHQAAPGSGLAVAATEHPSTLAAATARPDGHLLPVDADGRLDLAAGLPDVALCAVSLANHETGVLQDLTHLRALTRDRGAGLHVDLCQALGRVPVHLAALDPDTASFSAHKLGGLPGIGALIVRSGAPLRALWAGGAQEAGQRPGTESALLAGVFAAAARDVLPRAAEEADRLATLSSHLRSRICDLGADARVLTPETGALPNTLNVAFTGRRGAHLVLQLDALGVSVSHGSACASGSAEPSPALLAMGVGEDVARAALRISLGHDSSRDDVEQLVRALHDALASGVSQRAQKNAEDLRRT